MTSEPSPRADRSRRLTVLSPAERLALYGVPDFDEFQRAQYFAFAAPERALAEQRKGFTVLSALAPNRMAGDAGGFWPRRLPKLRAQS